MRVLGSSLVLAALCATNAEAQSPAACDLLTAAEVEAAAGWKSAVPKAETYGTTSTCTFTGNALKHEVVVVTLATKAEPVEGLGAPAIRSDDGSGPATIESVTGGRIAGVSAPTIEAATALAKQAIPRVR